MSPKTIRNIHAILSGAFSCAVRWEWIDRNPAASAKPPKARYRPPSSPTPAGSDQSAGAMADGVDRSNDLRFRAQSIEQPARGDRVRHGDGGS